MARIISVSTNTTSDITNGWELLTTDAGALESPALLPATGGWIAALVPGTVALARQRAGQWQLEAPQDLHANDHWYRVRFSGAGPSTLRFNGLATLAEVWLNQQLILRSDNMFVAHDVAVTLDTDNELCICFRALDALLSKPAKRAKWRPTMIVPASLRLARTTLLGSMPGWCPAVSVVGPWRGISCVNHDDMRITRVALRSELRGNDTGVLRVTINANSSAPHNNATLHCAGATIAMQRNDQGEWFAELIIDSINAWWPNTHGHPHLYAVSVTLGATQIDLGKTGFRRVDVIRGEYGQDFSININGTRVFCRGACWTSADLVGLASKRETYAPWLQLMRDANMNMVRVGGTMLYEDNAFYELCDELGIMVWQDFMFANFDYPVADAAFEASVRSEVTQFLDRTQASPSITVLCGGSEVSQQAAMLGMPSELWTSVLFNTWLPELCTALRPDVAYVTNSPSGGELPFIANAGATHYYGVGAYMRPLEDARRAEVKFASECLAFANVPEDATLHESLPVLAVHHPLWKQRVPRDNGASWDFEDVRDYYFAHLFKLDPAYIRRSDPERYLALSRAVTAEVMETTFNEWRRSRSPTAGGLVWNYQDLMPGAGWGVVDALRRPKSAWYALRRAFRPLHVMLTDEGVNGLSIHAINDGADTRKVKLELNCQQLATSVVAGSIELTLEPHAGIELNAWKILGRFFDISYAYRFGPPAHDLTVATLRDALSNEVIAEAVHFPQGYNVTPQAFNWQARVERVQHDWYVCLRSEQLATSVHISDEHYRPEDNWFHLPPNSERRIRLIPTTASDSLPDGEVRALNSAQRLRYRGQP